MDWYTDYKLVEDNGSYTLVINLNQNSTEFSSELGESFKENLLNLDDKIRKFVKEKFSDIKVNTVKLVLGTMVVASIPFAASTKVQAAELNASNSQQASEKALDTTGIVTASKLNVRTGPSTSYSVMHTLWQGNNVKVIGESNGWYKIQLSDGRTGWVSGTYLKLTEQQTTTPQVNDRETKINTVISKAKSLLGTPYVWGGESLQEGGFDCSGLTQYVYKMVGVDLNRISADQAKQGTTVSRANLQPGDLVFYSFEGTSNINHVGIYIGENKMIHSPKAGDVVKITDISTSYWESRFVTAKRVL
ncbi:C40 family peptidase [Clostridium thermarum]|uniref:C40 family peptidase n=1 Tax=Clostridium thermarum TaxID=1716543 RepID=UPI00111EC031|nr:C40 family peptidase [Clostridium thermarum]